MIKDKDFEDFENEDDEIDQSKLKIVSEMFRQTILRKIEQQKDTRTKHIGDNVLVWDCSRLTNAETNELDYQEMTHRTLGNYPSIVIETDNTYVATTTFGATKVLDLVVWNKNLNKKFRTSSDFVKLKD